MGDNIKMDYKEVKGVEGLVWLGKSNVNLCSINSRNLLTIWEINMGMR
jgi:hypothetical protein